MLVFADFLRVYFSTRRPEGQYYYSDVAYVDYDLDFRKILNFSSHQVIEKGVLGSFDSDGIFPFHVFKSKRDNERVFGLICGWKRKVSIDIDMVFSGRLTEFEKSRPSIQTYLKPFET